ncbi:MAG: protein hydE [Helicobacteraceae bacterium]|nr:protein hydE [Helicobacteraceae bacterium]
MQEIIAGFVFEKINDFNAHLTQEFFLKILKDSTQRQGLESQIVALENGFICEVKGDKDSILNLSQILQKKIPLSLNIAFRELVLLESFSDKNIIDLKLESKSDFLTPLELQGILNKDSSDFCNLWGEFLDYKQEKITLLENGKKIKLDSKESLKKALENIATQLKANKKIFFKTSLGKFEAVLFNENMPLKNEILQKEHFFMPFDLECAKVLFKVESYELEALATLEKPILTLSAKSIFKEHFNNECKVILPSMPYLALLSKFLESQGLYLIPLESKINSGICAFVESSAKPLVISVSESGLIVPHNFTQDFTPLKAFKNTIAKNNLTRTSALYLGQQDSKVLVYFDNSFKSPLEFCFNTDLSKFLEILSVKNDTTKSLLTNFTKEFSACVNKIKALKQDSKDSSNLLDLLGLAGILLDFKGENLSDLAKCVLEEAANFMGKKGPRIDFKLERSKSGEIYLNTEQTLRSIMSFRLAGVEPELLCFGILDSLAEFFANFIRDMEENYQTSGVIIAGSTFLNKQFLNQFLHYLPKNIEIYVPSDIELES